VNAWNGDFNLNDSKGLLDACAKGFSEHPQLPKAVPASAFVDVYLQCRNRCHGPSRAFQGKEMLTARFESAASPIERG
jgi:hypothetical protein